MRSKFPWLTLKDVVNSVQKLRVAQLGGSTEMEALHAKLKNERVLSSSRRDSNNRLTRLFFSPTSSQSLIPRNCDVLLMDCTYQSNKHKMPLLHVVRATGTHATFTVACCFMENELEATYKWAISALERCLPAVVVLDHEKALINAVEVLWPSTRINLCRWHIGKNITANCMKKGMSELVFKKVTESWNRTVKTATLKQDFLDQWSVAHDELLGNASNYPRHQAPRDAHTIRCLQQAFTYINKNKLPLIDRIASYSVNQQLHFDHTTTSRAEGAHWSSIKLHLQRAQGLLLDVYDRIDKSTGSRLARLSNTLNRERVEVLALPMGIFGPVLRCITHFALKEAHKQYTKALHAADLRACSGATKSAWGLPCAHEISRLIQQKKALAPTDFDQHWPKEMLDQDPDVHGVLDPLTVERTRGRRPNEQHARATTRIPSLFEIVEAERAPKRSNNCTRCHKPGHNKRSCRSTRSNVRDPPATQTVSVPRASAATADATASFELGQSKVVAVGAGETSRGDLHSMLGEAVGDAAEAEVPI